MDKIDNRINNTINSNINTNIINQNIDIKLLLKGYVNSNQGRDYSTRKSTTRYIFLFNGTPISQSSKLQKSVIISSIEAEYMALKEGFKELIQLKAIFNQLEPLKLYILDILYSDNIGAIYLSRNPEYYTKIKHINI